ncbi:V-type ATP synthase subunit E [Treponema parvum]|uniref:V-type ATP synthase subunit E n=1 Tax=Treponema parvum TaxID=138851 RepID=A0A975F4B5_9SPIR|nr:V-type ATP synthase subunit E [Treponema parvum]QTQ14093.1 V-type ATP synthase subunit E [Treponema parvum]
MDVQLQELIDKIKKDGVAAAKTSAENIISEAEVNAKKIIADAEQQVERILKNAKTETDRMEKAAEDAVKQAGRNLIISFRESIVSELNALVQAEAAKAYSPALMEKLIPETVKAWVSKEDAKDVSVILNEKSLKELEKGLHAALKTQIAKGLELKADKTISAGFRIGINNGEAYYDYSAEAVADLFSAYLNPRVSALMKAAVTEGK